MIAVGSMSMLARRATLEAFQTKPEVRVILLGLKAGGEGLNLTQASHVFLIDPWWYVALSTSPPLQAGRAQGDAFCEERSWRLVCPIIDLR